MSPGSSVIACLLFAAQDPAQPPRDPQPPQSAAQEVAEAAQDEHRRQDPPSGQFEDRERGPLAFLLLDWGGVRSRLEDTGLEVGLLLTADASWAAAGGADPGSNALRSLLELSLSFDTGPLLGLEGGTVFSELEIISGDDASTDFGLLQAFSNIDAEHRFQLSRLWYEQRFAATGTTARVGKMDANTLFAYVDGGAGFLHSSMGFSPTILGLPTYPDPSFGVALSQRLVGEASVSLGVFDGAAQEGVPTGSRGPKTLFGEPDDLFLIGELGLDWDGGRAGLGGWAHTGRFERFDGDEEHGTQGLYAVLDQRLVGGRDEDAEPCGLDGFLQLGAADPDVSLFELHVGTGLAWTCPFSTSVADELGLGLTAVRISEQAGLDEDLELGIELYYGFEPVPWVRLKPDLQYIVNPGGDASLDDALLLSLRLTASL